MGFFDRLSRLLRANVNDLVSKAEDPVKILDQSVADMQEDLVKLRQAVAMAIASQKRLRNQADQAESQARTWYERAELALKKNEEDLAREALTRRKTFQETSASLAKQVQGQDAQVETLKKSLVALEGKIAEARTKKDMLKARAQAAKAQQSSRVQWGIWVVIPPWRPLSGWRTRFRRWKPAVRPRPNWQEPIWRASSQPLRVEMMLMMILQPFASNWRVGPKLLHCQQLIRARRMLFSR